MTPTELALNHMGLHSPFVSVVMCALQVDSRTAHGPCVVVAYSPTAPTLRITLPVTAPEGEAVDDGSTGIDLDAAEDASQGPIVRTTHVCLCSQRPAAVCSLGASVFVEVRHAQTQGPGTVCRRSCGVRL